MQTTVNDNTLNNHKLEKILDRHHSLSKTDIIWILESIKKKVAEEDPNLLALSQPRLLQNFRYFAEISMMLIHQTSFCDQEVDRLKSWVSEASFGLFSSGKPPS